MTKKLISVSLDESLLELLDNKIGDMPRSRYIAALLRKDLGIKKKPKQTTEAPIVA